MRPRSAAALLVALSLSACAISHPDYPAAWAPLEVAGTGCVSVAGRYADAGDSSLLFPRNTSLGGANRLVITEPEAGVIEIAAWHDTEGATATRLLVASANDYRCRDRMIELSRRELVTGGQAAAVETNTVRLTRSTDGSLVIKHTSSGVGLCVIVPCGGSVDKWYRLEPANAK